MSSVTNKIADISAEDIPGSIAGSVVEKEKIVDTKKVSWRLDNVIGLLNIQIIGHAFNYTVTISLLSVISGYRMPNHGEILVIEFKEPYCINFNTESATISF